MNLYGVLFVVADKWTVEYLPCPAYRASFSELKRNDDKTYSSSTKKYFSNPQTSVHIQWTRATATERKRKRRLYS